MQTARIRKVRIVHKKNARTNAYNRDTVKLLLRRIRRGESLTAICKKRSMPSIDTVLSWIQNDYRSFERKYYSAKAVAMELHDAELLDIADSSGYTPGEIGKARLQTDTRKWRMERNARARFGGSSHVTLAGDPNAPLRIEHPKKRLRYRLATLKKRIEATQQLLKDIE